MDRQHAKMNISEIEGIEVIEFFELEQDSIICKKFSSYRNEWRKSDYKPIDKKSIYSPEEEIEDWIIQSVNILEGKEYFWIDYGFVSKWCGKIRIVDPKRFVASQSGIFLMECDSGTIYDVACYSSDEYHHSLFVWGGIVPYIDKMEEYLKEDTVINYKCESIAQLSNQLFQKADNELDYIKIAYEYVRDNISHSADINEDLLTCTASEVLEAGHGICFAKSHLVAALLRAKSIPTGFCYQKLILDDETAPVLIYHGLNGVYISDMKKWIRLDARGNKEGVNAQFSLDTEQLAFPIRPELGEVDSFVVYPEPDVKVLERLREYDTRSELWDDLPTELGYVNIEVKTR